MEGVLKCLNRGNFVVSSGALRRFVTNAPDFLKLYLQNVTTLQ